MLRRTAYYTSSFYIFLVFFCLPSCVPTEMPSEGPPLKPTKLILGDPTTRNSSLPPKFKNKKICLYMVHGIGGNDIRVLRQLAQKLKQEVSHKSFDFECPGQTLDAIPVRVNEIITHIRTQERHRPHDYYFLIGYSLGGLVATDVATQLCKKNDPMAQKLAGVVTINSPMGGIKEDEAIKKFAEAMMNNLGNRKDDLKEGSQYLRALQNRVSLMNFPILSIASQITLSETGLSVFAFLNNFNAGEEITTELRRVLPKSDIMIYVPSQVAVKDWRPPTPRNIAVKAYQGYLHGDTTTLSPWQQEILQRGVEQRRSILDKPDMHTLLANFIDNPEETVRQCGIEAKPKVINEK